MKMCHMLNPRVISVLLTVLLAIGPLSAFLFNNDNNNSASKDDEGFLEKAISKVKKTVVALLNRLNFTQIMDIYKQAKGSNDLSGGVKGLLGILRNGDRVDESDLEGVNLGELSSLFGGKSDRNPSSGVDISGESNGFSGLSKSISKLDKLQRTYDSVKSLKRVLTDDERSTQTNEGSSGTLGALGQLGSLLSNNDAKSGNREAGGISQNADTRGGSGEEGGMSGLSRSLSQLDSLQKTYKNVNELRQSFSSADEDAERVERGRKDESGGLITTLMNKFNTGK